MIQTLTHKSTHLSMERLAQLIGKLNEQFEQNADHTQLLVTTQLIEAELLQLSSASRRTVGTSKVAVVMPSNRYNYNTVPAVAAIEEKAPVVEEKTIPPVQQPEKNGSHTMPKPEKENGWHFDPLKEIPTLAHQAVSKELNDFIGASAQSSLNDKFAQSHG